MEDKISSKKTNKKKFNEIFDFCECVTIEPNINKENAKTFLITDLYGLMNNFKIILYFDEKIDLTKLYNKMDNILIEFGVNGRYNIINSDKKCGLYYRPIYKCNIITNLLLCSLIKKKLKIKKNKIIIPLYCFNKLYFTTLFFEISIKIIIYNLPIIINKINLQYLRGYFTKNNIDSLICKKKEYFPMMYSNEIIFEIDKNLIYLFPPNKSNLIFMSIYKENKLIKFPKIISLEDISYNAIYKIKKINLHIKNFKSYVISFGKLKKIIKQIRHKKKDEIIDTIFGCDDICIIINFDRNINENYKFNFTFLY